jgi:hypothetical protein
VAIGNATAVEAALAGLRLGEVICIPGFDDRE